MGKFTKSDGLWIVCMLCSEKKKKIIFFRECYFFHEICDILITKVNQYKRLGAAHVFCKVCAEQITTGRQR